MDYFAGMKRRDLQALCKRHGLPAGGTNAALAARLADAAVLPGDAGAEDEVVARKGCLKRPDGGNDLGEAKKVSFALKESRRRRRRSQVACSPVVGPKTRGRSKAGAETRSASSSPDAEAGRRGRGQQMRAEAVGGSANEGSVSADVGAPVRRSRSNLVGLGDVDAVEAGETVAVDRKRKQRSQEKEEETSVGAQVGVPCRITRRSSLAGAAPLPPLAVEKKRGRGKVANDKNKLDAEEQVAEAQGLAEAKLPVIVESRRNGRKKENCDLVVQKSVTMEAPVVIESKRRRITEYEQPQVELHTVLEAPTNDAPVTRVLRNRVAQVNSSEVEETYVDMELENKRQPSRPATRRSQQLASSMEEEDQEQVPAPSKCPPLRRSRRNNLEPIIANSETKKLNSLPMEDSAKGEDMEKQPTAKEPARQLTRKSIISAMLEKEDNDLAAEKGPEPEACVTRAKRKSFVPVPNIQDVSEEFQNAKGDDVVKQPAVKEPTRRSTRKSIVSAMVEEGDNVLVAEKGSEPDAHVTRLKRKSVVPVKNIQDVSDYFQNTKGDDLVKQPVVKEPARRSTRKSDVSAMLEEGNKDLVGEKVPEPGAHVTKVKRKPVVLVNNIQDVSEEFQNAECVDVVKQPAVKEPTRRSTHKSVISAMLEEEDTNLIAEKSPEVHVKTLKRKSVVPVRDSKGNGEETRDAKGKDVAKQPAVKDPVRRSTRKSVVSALLEEEDKDLFTHKSPEAQDTTLKRKSIVPVKDNQGGGEGSQNAKGEDVVKQLTFKVPSRRSTRKSVASDMLGKEENDFIAAKKPEAHDRTSVRKSVLPNTLNKENQDNSKMVRNEGKGGDEEKHLSVEGPFRLSRRSIATVVSEKENKGLHEETNSEISMTRSTRQSVAPNAVEKGDMDLTEMVGREPSGVETRNLKARDQITEHPVAMATSEKKLQVEVSIQNSLRRSARKHSNHKLSDDNKTHSGLNKYISCEKAGQDVLKVRKRRRFSVDISSPPSDACNVVDFMEQKFRKQSDTQTPNKIDSKGTNQVKTTSKGRPAKRRRTTVQEEIMSVEEAKCEDMVSREAICDTVTLGNESGSRIHEICQVNATGEEFSSSPLPVMLTLPVQTRHNVIPRLESADAQNPDIYPSHGRVNSDKSKQTQKYYDIQTDDSLLSETSNGECDQSSSITELLQHNGIVSEDKISRDVGEVNFSNKGIQIVNASSDEVGLEILNTSSGRSTTAVLIVDAEAHPMAESPTVNAEIKQSDAEVSQIVSSCCDGITVTVTEPQFAGQKDSQGVSTDASGSAPPISDSKQENHSVEPSIQAADLGKYLSKDIKGNPLSPNLGADADKILPALGAAKGSSSDESHSSFGLDFLFAEERKGSSSRNDINTVVEVDYESKPSACITPSFCMKSDCGVECENAQPLGYDTDKTLDVSQDVAQEDFIAVEKSSDERDTAEIDLKTKSNYEAVGLYMKSDCILAETNMRLVADNCDAAHNVVQVKQDAVQEGSLEKASLCSTAPESKLEEAGLHSIRNKRCSSCVEQSPLGLQSLFSQESLDDSMEHGAPACGTSHIESGVDQLRDSHVKCTVEKITASQPISHRDTHLVSESDDCMYMSQQSNGIEGLPEVSHDGESSSLSCFLVDENNRKEVIKSVELVCKGEGNKNIFHSEDLNPSCEKSEVDVSVDCASGIGCTVLSCPLHAPGTDNGDVRLGSNLSQLESANLLDKQIRSSNTEVQHPSQKEHCIEDRENQVAVRLCTNDIMEAATAKCIESGAVLLPVEGSENLKNEQLNSKLKSAQALECGLSMEKSLEESAMSVGKNVSSAGTVGNPSFDSAMSEHKGALFEEVVHQMKNYVETSPSNPKELLIELQSTSSKGNNEESDLDNLAHPISGFRGDDSTIVEQRVKVHSDSSLSQLTSNDFLDESIQCSNMEMPHQGQKKRCNGDSTEEQVASGPWTYDTTDAATVKYIESEVDLHPVEGRSELQYGQLKSALESPKAVESSLNNDDRNILDKGSAGIVVYEKFLFGDKNDSRVGGSIGDSLSGLASSNHKHKDMLSEEVVNTMNNYVGTCPSNPRELLMELQSSPNATFEDVDSCDNLAFPNTAREGDASTICHVENLVDTVVSSEPDLCLSLSQGFSRDKGKQGCMSVSLHDDEKGICQSSGWMHTDENNSKPLSCDAEVLRQHRVEECHEVNEDEVTTTVLENYVSEAAPFERMESTIMLVGEGEKYSVGCDKNTGEIFYNESMKNSMSELPKECYLDSRQEHEVLDVLSAPKCPEESTDCQDENVLGPGTSYAKGQKCTDERSSMQLTSHIGVLNQDQYYEINKHQTTPCFPAIGLSEGALLKRSGSVINVASAAGSSALRDEQLSTKLEGPETEGPNCVTDKDTSSLIDPESAVKSKASNLPKNTQLDPSSEHNLQNFSEWDSFSDHNFPNNLSASGSPEGL